MKNLALSLAGAVLSNRFVFGKLFDYAQPRPHAHLYDFDGTLYMGRWRVIDEGTRASRILRFLTGYESCRIHRIAKADRDRDLHNHPFHYRTFVMRGFYVEERGGLLLPATTVLTKGDTAAATPDDWHRISRVSEGGVWTLLFMTKNTGAWGFQVNGRFVDSIRYFLRRDYTKEQVRAANTL